MGSSEEKLDIASIILTIGVISFIGYVAFQYLKNDNQITVPDAVNVEDALTSRSAYENFMNKKWLIE